MGSRNGIGTDHHPMRGPMPTIIEERRAGVSPEAPPRVLLLESSEVERLTSARFLKHSPGAFTVCTVNTLEAALLSMRARPYDAIVLDLDAHESNLTTVIKELALAAPASAILVLGSRADDSMASLACELGAQDYLLKQELTQELFIRALRCAIGRKRHEARLTDWAYMDTLTGLVNRRLFCDRLAQALARAARADKAAALLFIDLDNFKTINDSLGHGAGDDVLRRVAHILRGAVRHTDTVARFGGDEFVVLLEPLEDSGRVELVAQKMLRALEVGLVLPAAPARVTASIGVGLFPQHAIQGDALLRSADAAMFLAKQHGGNRFRLACTRAAE
jgi:two-component system cell cycle response regulator